MTEEIKAKEYLRQRLGAERRMSAFLEEKLKEATTKILNILHRYGIKAEEIRYFHNPRAKREIEEVIRWLKDTLYDEVQSITIQADDTQDKHILAFINMPIMGMTLYTRLQEWTDAFQKWVLSIYGNGISTTPSVLPMNTGALYGMDRLLRHTIARAWMEAKKQNAINRGASFFSAHRGSSYPCATCDDEQAKGLQPISQFSLPLHNNCCCYAIFYDANKQPMTI